MLVFQKRISISIYCVWLSKFSYLYLQKDLRSAWTIQKCWVLLASSTFAECFLQNKLHLYLFFAYLHKQNSWNWISVFLPLLIPASFLFSILKNLLKPTWNFPKKMFLANCCIWRWHTVFNCVGQPQVPVSGDKWMVICNWWVNLKMWWASVSLCMSGKH